MKRLIIFVLIAALAFVLAGCNGSQISQVATEAPAADTPAPTPEPTPTPQPLIIDAATGTPTATPVPTPTPNWSEPAKQAFSDALNLNYEEYESFFTEVDFTLYATVVENTEHFKNLTSDINTSVQSAMQAAADSASALVSEPTFNFDGFVWQQVAGFVRAYGLDSKEMIEKHLSLTTTDDGTFSVAMPLYDVIIESDSESQVLTAKFTLAYLNTVYDDDGVEKDYESYPVPEDYLLTVANPVPGNHMKDGWYQNRSKATRKHVGMDITGRYKTPILSVTDGTVVYRGGEHPTCGYYIVIEDEYGYEYHYYHFAEMTTLQVGDYVKQGDIVGLMGKTGNSDGVHLHIAIIAPDYSYINPYEFFEKAGLTD
ncbi:MAG: M23 family metallopeptidase [Clostridia bacterium]|nr:M23 family metallopeptidase [Clostridia bacterium]